MDDSLIGAVLEDTKDKMQKAIEHAQAEFSAVRTGRATPALVEKLRIDYYGTEVPLQQIAGFSVPEARLLVISPYDKSSLSAIERAIQNSDLGMNPSNDGNVIRLTVPQLTAERRKEMVKRVHSMAEDGRVAVRNVRRAARKDLEGLEKDGDITNDELDRAEKELQKLTDQHISEIDHMLARKEQELLEV